MQKLQLSIHEPCHENWQQMTPTEQGRFCNACAKEVVDFSSMTDIQVLNYFSTLTHQKVCGRALPEQLDRAICRPETPKKRLFWYWNYIVMFFILLGKGNAVKAQGRVKHVTEIIPAKKQNEINRALEGRVGGVSVTHSSRVITGKVTDIDGNPVSFASIKIKGTNTGVTADANGSYSIRIKPNDVLVISGASFKPIEVPVGIQSVFNSVLETSGVSLGYMIISHSYFGDGYYGPLDMTKQVAVLKVKDEETGKLLPNISMIINTDSKTDTVLTDRKGMYKIKGIKAYEKYFIKLVAEGYESAEFTISSSDINDRKKEWEVLLRKQKVETVIQKPGIETRIRMGGIHSINVDNTPIYVVDGVIRQGKTDISPDDVENISILNGITASAIYGSQGINGAILVITKKQFVNLDTLLITDHGTTTGVIKFAESCTSTVLGGMVKGMQVKATIADSIKMFVNKFQSAIKIYPNPVQRGEQFSFALKLKQTGLYQIQITDAAGRIVLQDQFTAVSKDHTEKILTDTRWSSGIYYISITDTKNQLVNKSSFIVR